MSTLEQENEQLKHNLQMAQQMFNDACLFYEATAAGYDPYVDTVDPEKLPKTPRFMEFLIKRAADIQNAVDGK